MKKSRQIRKNLPGFMSRDLVLGLVAAFAVVALAAVAWVQPPVSEQIIVALAAIATSAIGRFSGANGETKP